MSFQIRLLSESEFLSQVGWLCALRSARFNWDREALTSSFAPPNETYGLFLGNDCVAVAVVRTLSSAHELLLVAVQPAQRRAGWSKCLLKQLIDAKSHDRPWWLELHAENREALALYQSLGFKVVGERPRYYQDQGAALTMTRIEHF